MLNDVPFLYADHCYTTTMNPPPPPPAAPQQQPPAPLPPPTTTTNDNVKSITTNGNESAAMTKANAAATATEKDRQHMEEQQAKLTQDFQERKKSLTLDFSNPEAAKKTISTSDVISLLGLKTSVGLSPEIERFFTQNVVVSNTPTPTQFIFPKNVTAEQEQYARGFIDALNQLHQMRGCIPMSNLLSPGFITSTVVQPENNEDSKVNDALLAWPTRELQYEAARTEPGLFASNSTSDVFILRRIAHDVLLSISRLT
ncbi:unnamed protein product [Soboliphyme baturini]|uniref:Jun domain-containing protein n=1 Tax=Soboliphyme baturini TaxID=241478 RepID=A0A183J753_9BILA|nr:unnamed protein product [Soboliphyme baturini]